MGRAVWEEWSSGRGERRARRQLGGVERKGVLVGVGGGMWRDRSHPAATRPQNVDFIICFCDFQVWGAGGCKGGCY